MKTGTVIVDLTAAFDTVWRKGVLYKLIDVIHFQTTVRLINNMLNNRVFQVFLNGNSSSKRMLNNGLPQGSVLAPLLFILYIHDLPETQSKKFGYADDWTLAAQHQNLPVLENILASDLVLLQNYL